MSDDGLTALLEEQLASLGHIVFRRMFGGFGVFCDGLMFGLINDGVLYFKADADTRPAFETEGLEPITYEARGRTIVLPYWPVPERLLDEPDEMLAWAQTALAVARRAAARKRERPTARTKTTPAKKKAPAKTPAKPKSGKTRSR